MNINKGYFIKLLAAAGLIFTTIIWGSGFVVMKNSVDIIPPTYLLAFRFTIAAIALSIVFFPKTRTLNKYDIKYGSLLGIFLFTSYFFQTYGLKYTTASKNAFITTLYVILVPFFNWGINKKRPARKNIVAAVIAIIGLALLSLEGDLSINPGDALTLVCGLCYAVHIVFIERYAKEYDPVKLTVVQIAASAVLSWCIAPLLEGNFDFSVIDKGLAGSVLYLGIFATMVAFLLQNVGQKYLNPNTSSILLSFEAVFGLIFSVIFLNDPLTLKLISGCVLMFIAIIMSEYRKKIKTERKS